MIPFQALNRRARLLRLRQAALLALEAYGLAGAQLAFLRYGENAIYRVDQPVSPGVAAHNSPFLPGRYVLRIHACSGLDTIASELTWLAALAQQAGLPAPAPVHTPDGEHLVKIFTPGLPEGKVVTMLCWLDGRCYRSRLTPSHLFALGQVVAQMHSFSAGWQPPPGFDRFHWDWSSLLGGCPFREPRDEVVGSIPVRFREQFDAVSDLARLTMHALGKGPDAYGMIHADLYPENVLFKSGQAYPIDFEDCGYGYWLWDIAVALCTWAWQPGWERLRDAFTNGYEKVRSLPGDQWKLLDQFIAFQFATMLLWASSFLLDYPQRSDEYRPWRDESGEKLAGFRMV